MLLQETVSKSLRMWCSESVFLLSLFGLLAVGFGFLVVQPTIQRMMTASLIVFRRNPAALPQSRVSLNLEGLPSLPC